MYDYKINFLNSLLFIYLNHIINLLKYFCILYSVKESFYNIK